MQHPRQSRRVLFSVFVIWYKYFKIVMALTAEKGIIIKKFPKEYSAL